MSNTTNQGAADTERTGAVQFLKEVRTELRRVAWPSRSEVAQYSVIVLLVTLVIGAYVFGLDFLFGELVFWIFG